MKGFTQSRSFKILLIAVVALLAVIIFTAAYGGSFISSVLGFMTTPAQSISTSVTNNVVEYLDLDSLTPEELKQKSRELSDLNAQLTARLVDYETMKRENEQLKKQLGIAVETEGMGMDTLAAAVVSRDVNDVFGGFSIDKGYLQGISKGDPVISDRGLVGIISEVYGTTSVVKTILSEDIRVYVKAQTYEDSGVLQSDIKTADEGLVRMNMLKNDTEVDENTVITTSGASGMLPSDIVVGYIVSVEQSESDVSKYAVVQPTVDIKNVKDVVVITGFPGKDEMPADTEETESSENQDTEA